MHSIKHIFISQPDFQGRWKSFGNTEYLTTNRADLQVSIYIYNWYWDFNSIFVCHLIFFFASHHFNSFYLCTFIFSLFTLSKNSVLSNWDFSLTLKTTIIVGTSLGWRRSGTRSTHISRANQNKRRVGPPVVQYIFYNKYRKQNAVRKEAFF